MASDLVVKGFFGGGNVGLNRRRNRLEGEMKFTNLVLALVTVGTGWASAAERPVDWRSSLEVAYKGRAGDRQASGGRIPGHGLRVVRQTGCRDRDGAGQPGDDGGLREK